MSFKSYAIKAVDSIFLNFGMEAQIIFDDATTADITVVHRAPDKITDVLDSRVHSGSDVFEVKKADATKTIKQIIVNEKTYNVHGEPMLDQYGLVLRVDAYAD